MHGYELPIDLEVLKAMPRPLPAWRPHSATPRRLERKCTNPLGKEA